MTEKKIIEGLMLYLKNENINITKLIKRIGMKDYKKFDEAFQSAYQILYPEKENDTSERPDDDDYEAGVSNEFADEDNLPF